MRRIGLSWVGLLAALSVSGCIVEITFDPIGTDASMAGQWTINGAAPTQASCDALGVSHVRVRFYDGTRGVDHPGLVFPCAQGSFDTRPDAVVADGVWTAALVAVDASGTAIGTAPQQTFDTLAVGGHITLTSVNFEAASTVTTLAGAWTINGAAPTAASCAELGATEIHVQFLDGSGAPGDDTLKLPCTDGNFSEPMDPGAYNVRVVAVDATSGVIGMAAPQAVTLTQGMTTTLTTVNFDRPGFDPTGTDASYKLTWRIGGSTATIAEQCAAVGGGEIDVVFYAADDLDFEDPYGITVGDCSEGAFESVTAELAAGTYWVDVYLFPTVGDDFISYVELGELTVTAGTPLDLGEVDFRLEQSTIVASISWEVPATPATYGSCAEAGVAAVNWQVRATGTTTPLLMGAADEACVASFEIDASTLAAGDYNLYYDGETAAGAKSWMPLVTTAYACEGALDGEDGGLAVLSCRASYTP